MKAYRLPSKQAGFSLIDMLVGAAIGLLAIVVIMYSFKAFEGQKRTTDSLAGAQSDGLMAMTTLDTSIRQAGLGLFTNGSLLCSSVNIYYNGSTVANMVKMMPVAITDGGGGASDTINIITSQSAFGAASVPVVMPMPSPSAIITVSGNPSVNVGDLVLVGDPTTPGTPCTVMGVTNVATTAIGVDVQHNSGTSLWNPPNPVTAFTNAPAYGTSALMLPLGTFSRLEYQALCNSLVSTDLNNGSATPPSCVGSTFTNATPLAANVVNIQAQYGVIPVSLAGGIACWVNATVAGTNACDASDWSSPTLANTKRIEAIRLAVTVISPQIEKPNTTGACTATASTTASNYPVSWPGGPAIDVTTLPNWKCYRYKVFQTITPIRNAIWAN